MTPFEVRLLPRSTIEDIHRVVSETLAGSGKKGLETVFYYTDPDDAPPERSSLGFKILLEHRARGAVICERSRRKPFARATCVYCLGHIKSITPLSNGTVMLLIGDSNHILTLIPEVPA